MAEKFIIVKVGEFRVPPNSPCGESTPCYQLHELATDWTIESYELVKHVPNDPVPLNKARERLEELKAMHRPRGEEGKVVATLMPSEESRSIRQERLPQDARDLLAWAFASNIPVNPALPIPMTACEVRLDDPIKHICEGGEGWRMHGGSDSLEYFTHFDDEDWAVVFAWDLDGDPERGMAIAQMMGGDHVMQ